MNDENTKRDREIYCYLYYLASSVPSPESKPISDSEIGRRLGLKDLGGRIKKHYISPSPNSKMGENQPAVLTTGGLVERISCLKNLLIPEIIIRKEDIFTLFRYIITLTPAEKQQLGLSQCEADAILQQSLFNVSLYDSQEQQGAILDLYKASIGLTHNPAISSNLPSENIKDKKFIVKNIKGYFKNLGLEEKNAIRIEELCHKIQRRINRIESQAGLKEATKISTNEDTLVQKPYFTEEFIKNLIMATIENEFVRECIPIYLEYLNIEKLDPLPLYFNEDDYIEGLLNPEINHKNRELENAGLASLHTYQVSVSFNLKLDNEKFIQEVKEDLPPEVKVRLFKSGKKGIVFTVTSSGVGAQMSQVIKVINRALFWDVECIRDRYFPIAHDLVINQEVIKSNIASPVWSHSLVRLCRLDYLREALCTGKTYAECVHIDEIARGDYCGFNLLETTAKSALQARLSAILKTHINPQNYIKELTYTVIHREILRIAQEYLYYYPFSLNAMKSYLEKYLFKKHRDNNQPRFFYDAYLSIIEAYLKEGLYRKANEYFNEIKELEDISKQNLACLLSKAEVSSEDKSECQIFSGASLIKYEIFQAYYYYIFDEEDKDPKYRLQELPKLERSTFIGKAWDSLEKANQHIEIRIKKYSAINEISQSFFHPYFLLLAQINFLKAKLFLFFPTYSTHSVEPRLKDIHYARIHFLENSRIYAAKNGDKVIYAEYTAYQVWLYIMAAYLVNKSIKVQQSNKSPDVNLTREKCLLWAKKLRDHALISYAEFGRKCYYQIKEKSGITSDGKYGNQMIEKLPLIREERGEEKQGYGFFDDQGTFHNDNILYIDMTLLHMRTLDNSEEELEESIYLFGAKVAILLFARGMYELCGEENTETEEQWRKKIHKAYRLFTYAWAIAEDGGETTIPDHNQGDEYRIIRPDFRGDRINANYPPPEAFSVRDIYPHRQSEIADLGKVFAIACNLHLIYLAQSQEQKEKLKSEIDQLTAHFHDISRCRRDLTAGQTIFNAHLRPYLTKIKERLIPDELAKIENTNLIPNPTGMETIRTRIMTNFFDSLENTTT